MSTTTRPGLAWGISEVLYADRLKALQKKADEAQRMFEQYGGHGNEIEWRMAERELERFEAEGRA